MLKEYKPLGPMAKPEGERRYQIDGYGEVALTAKVWEDLPANLVENEIEKLRVGGSGEYRFQGSFNLGKSRVRRVQ